MNKYTCEKNALQLIALMKAHGVRRIIASPGNKNIPFIASIQNDPYFEIYSCVDERSAAYMACGMAEESGEPVALSCTGATAARNYPSGLTEAFYRRLPVLAITASQHFSCAGHMIPQFTDRSRQFNDIVTLSVQIPYPYSEDEYWSNNVKINQALLQLRRKPCGGPVHINIETLSQALFTEDELPKERVIYRYNIEKMPRIEAGKVYIFVGSHSRFSPTLESAVDEFCEKYNAVVLCDQTSNYKGKYRVLGGIVVRQKDYYAPCRNADLIIHIGEISGSAFTFQKSRVWRVNPDGEIRDPFRLLCGVFQMEEIDFFQHYNREGKKRENTYISEWRAEIKKVSSQIGSLPLSNPWLSQQTAPKLPEGAVLHLGILNSLRSWNLFETPASVYSYANVGGFGIDGIMSTCIGASLVDRTKLHFCVLGDLATFYDINVLGNRNVGNNVRILVVNNGTGYEMHTLGSIGSHFPFEEADRFFAAGGHNGNQSRDVLRHFATDLGFEYIKAETKEEYLSKLDYFVSPKMHEKPLLFEVFVDVQDDDKAYKATRKTIVSSSSVAKNMVKGVLGDKNLSKIKRIISK